MSVMCHTCGRQSQDREFCDHCNADLGEAGQSLPPDRCPLTAAGVPLSEEKRHVLAFPESWIRLEAEGASWRVHWISQRDWRERGVLYQQRLDLCLPCLPPGRLLDDAHGRWLVFEKAREASHPWLQTTLDDPLIELQRLSAYLGSLAAALGALHRNSYLWLNFDPSALEDGGSAEGAAADRRLLRITNLDVELFPFQSMPERVRVHPHYAAPELVQYRLEDIGPATDVYHLAMFAYYWIAGKLPDGLPGGGPECYDYALPALRIFAPHLPEGIIPVVVRALAAQPRDRYPTPSAFLDAFDEALAAAKRRRAFAGALAWDLGGHTRAGRSKAELQRGNEDAILVKKEKDFGLALVADGVSTCDIGSGGLASMMTSIVVENALADGCSHVTFPAVVSAATRRGSEGLLEWALAHGCRDDLVHGKDLMGTTLTVGWLQGREFSLANLGDSRAYLITDETVEQLTVDGDLASDLLLDGAAPEEIRELGAMGRALRECVGGCMIDDDGAPTVLPESCQPKISRWPLWPGDVIVLCTDGLVEEGFFLEPSALRDLVRRNQDRSATDLALLLVEAADDMQRVPSILEPDGFGDNIACVVIKITEAV